MAKEPSPPPRDNGLNGRIAVPAWLFVAIVLAAAGVNVAAAVLPSTVNCP